MSTNDEELLRNFQNRFPDLSRKIRQKLHEEHIQARKAIGLGSDVPPVSLSTMDEIRRFAQKVRTGFNPVPAFARSSVPTPGGLPSSDQGSSEEEGSSPKQLEVNEAESKMLLQTGWFICRIEKKAPATVSVRIRQPLLGKQAPWGADINADRVHERIRAIVDGSEVDASHLDIDVDVGSTGDISIQIPCESDDPAVCLHPWWPNALVNDVTRPCPALTIEVSRD